MSKEPCFVCGREAELIFITVDKYDVRCDKCGKYIFHDGLHEGQYKELTAEQKETISKYVKDYNRATNKWAELGDIDELWMKIKGFNRNIRQERTASRGRLRGPREGMFLY